MRRPTEWLVVQCEACKFTCVYKFSTDYHFCGQCFAYNMKIVDMPEVVAAYLIGGTVAVHALLYDMNPEFVGVTGKQWPPA